MSTAAEIEALPESKLGTKEHWDQVYEREVAVFKDVGEEGEVWFGESSAKKMVSWTRSHLPPSTRPRVLDLGCGNGHFLFSLASRRGGYAGSDLTGVDYSQGSVDLARLIGAEKGEESDDDDDDDESDDESDGGEPAAEDAKPTEGSAKDVQFEAWDMLGEDGLSGGPWDLVTDKGTYDAISLSSAPLPPHNLPPAALYPLKLAPLVNPGGYFLITSCNFTEEEVRARFEGAEVGFSYHSRVEHPSFSFGGKKGSTVCTVAFQKA